MYLVENVVKKHNSSEHENINQLSESFKIHQSFISVQMIYYFTKLNTFFILYLLAFEPYKEGVECMDY